MQSPSRSGGCGRLFTVHPTVQTEADLTLALPRQEIIELEVFSTMGDEYVIMF